MSKKSATWTGKSGVIIYNERSGGFLTRPGGWKRVWKFRDRTRYAPWVLMDFRSGQSTRSLASDYRVPVSVIEDILRYYGTHPESARKDGLL